jgi:hypothetical protein
MRDSTLGAQSRLLRGWHPRSAVIAVVLLVTLAVAAALAYQAQQAVRSHRATAENVLRHYAALASGEFGRRAQRELYEVITNQLTRLASACDGTDRLPSLDQWVRVKDT